MEQEIYDNIITLNDSDGNEVQMELLDLISYRGNDYVVLLQVEDDADEVVIFQLEDDGDELESYVGIDDDYTLQAVFELFKERHKDDFNFTD